MAVFIQCSLFTHATCSQATSVGAVVIVAFCAFVTFVVVLDLSTAQRDGSILIQNAKTLISYLANKYETINAPSAPADPAGQPLAPK